MVVQGNFKLELVDATSGKVIREHVSYDGKIFVTMTPNTRFRLQLTKTTTTTGNSSTSTTSSTGLDDENNDRSSPLTYKAFISQQQHLRRPSPSSPPCHRRNHHHHRRRHRLLLGGSCKKIIVDPNIYCFDQAQRKSYERIVLEKVQVCIYKSIITTATAGSNNDNDKDKKHHHHHYHKQLVETLTIHCCILPAEHHYRPTTITAVNDTSLSFFYSYYIMV